MTVPDAPDRHTAFRGHFTLPTTTEIEIRILCPDPYLVWLDGDLYQDGPIRYPKGRPEYAHRTVRLAPGKHRLAIQVHHEGVTTRLMEASPPFLAIEVRVDEQVIPIAWKTSPLPGFASRMRRINPQLGWIEYADTRKNPARWNAPAFDDSGWAEPTFGETIASIPAKIPSPHNTAHPLHFYVEGTLADRFGYPEDEPAARFFVRALNPRDVPPDGVWRRYDLDRVRLFRPRFVLDLPAGTEVEFAYSETLCDGRVLPWINLSAGGSCNYDHYIAHGGPQEFMPVIPKGGRFMEIHILGTREPKFLREEFVERHYFAEAAGSFTCNDSLLNRIWEVGVDTFRACTEDALTDNPTRERGQWTGDVVTVGMGIAAAAFDDLRLVRRGLVQSAACARSDGLIAGLCPGGPAFLSTYAAQWISACLHYVERTGDRSLLDEVEGAARRNLDLFASRITDDGLPDDLGWAFVDWGYVRNPGPSDMALNLHVLAAFRDMERWSGGYREPARRLEATLRRYFAGETDWAKVGLHRTVLALRLGLVERDVAGAIASIKAHYLRCFPNDPSAPRLSNPSTAQERLITPYFSHYALAELWVRGEGDFVLDQYRTCWGWALEDGRTTWLEVFDPRWSHCHQWSGCPTWQLSRYVLGIQPRLDLGERTFDFAPRSCSLERAEGTIPAPGGAGIQVEYRRTRTAREWKLRSQQPFTLLLDGRKQQVEREQIITRA